MNAIDQLLTEHIDIWTAADTEKKSGRGRSSGNAASVYGIRKLRELILELAVRGKLVPQDPNDEPASELLKRIQNEKAKLIAEGKIKKSKFLPSITDYEKAFDLPQGWDWVRLGQIGDWGAGATPLRSISSYYGGETPWFKSGELTADFIDTSEETITDLALNECSLRLNQPGDVLIAMYGATIGKAAILKVPGTTNQAVCACTPNTGIFNRYLLILLKAMKSNFIGQGAGGAQPNISREKIIATVAAMPSTEEQRRIVAKVDELMELCDQLEYQHSNATEAHEKLVSYLLGTLTQSQSAEDFSANWQRIASHFDTLFTTEASIDALKQTLLQLAVMGKLVLQDPNDEPASELLKRIQNEKTKLIAEGKIKKGKPVEPITDEEKPFELPNGWQWVKCQDVCYKITDGEHATPRRSESGYYLLSARNVTNDGIVLDDVDYVPLDEFERIRSRCDPNIGDILISCSGSVGRVALVDKDNIYSMVRSAAMIRPNQNWLFKKYIALLLRSAYLQNQMKNRSKQAAQANLFLGAISNLVFIIPPLAEQHRIVAKVDELMALCDALKTRINEAQRIQIHLADTIVNQALA
jgi:type I restriction enzyme S subunit